MLIKDCDFLFVLCSENKLITRTDIHRSKKYLFMQICNRYVFQLESEPLCSLG